MLFNSIPFLILFIITYVVYWNVEIQNKKRILVLSSIIFYAYFSLLVAFHFFLIIVINFYFSEKLHEKKEKRESTNTLIKLIVILNLVNLSVFKYFYFFSDIFFRISHNVFFKEVSSSVNIILPLAISFYTFQLLALQIDIHRGRLIKKISFQEYFLFILFFPQLIAGPIMRTEDFLPQLNSPKITKDSMKEGLFLILGGLFKKVVLADNISPIINPLFANPEKFDSLSLLVGCFGFISQVYCDFSGYTDIARGLAKLLGFQIPENFRGPFLSSSFREFWTRWHITLSTWLRDYLYIPLGGSRMGSFRSSFNMLVTMTLGGLWHGANLTYLLWGFFSGLMLWLERILEKFGIPAEPKSKLASVFKTGVVYFAFAISGIFFRTGISQENSLELCLSYFKSLFQLTYSLNSVRLEEIILYIGTTFLLNYFQSRNILQKINTQVKEILLIFISFIMLLLLGLFGDGGGDFIYFQF
ncbi:MAG: MBOAT family protein [Leptospiraceae bacterium]|nr:MBOAT family protein [Leptospiraceae bacterium]MCK6381647.1 MBOAT family protein [Leptospiraceae bacterium]NUM41083.1 MBOAT family protein [Leptospiraceae bacterium]